MTNALYFGDNLDVLRRHVADESVDLVYLDPPFNSDAIYNVLFKSVQGERSEAQAEAFRDTWDWGESAEEAFDDLRQIGGQPFLLVDGLRRVLTESGLMAYVAMMAVRLIELRRVLRPTGSLYLHCDPTASHYLKILLDAIFGNENFRTEISWRRQSAHNDAKQGRAQYGNVRDTILFYTKSSKWNWNWLYTEYDDSYVRNFYKHIDPETGRRYRLSDLTGPGGAAKGNPEYELMGVVRAWRFSKEKMNKLLECGRIVQTRPGAVPAQKRYLDEMPGVPLQNDWNDIKATAGKEALGYPTQKPLALLERIIAASSNEGDVILDPFCGCGTTVHAAEKLHRNWIGIDVAHHAVTLIEDRLKRAFPTLRPNVFGRPSTLDGAIDLARRDKHQFQWWASWLVGCQIYRDAKRGADRGIDADVFFQNGPFGTGRAIVSVKGGDNVGVSMVRDLRGVVERENATMGVLVTLVDPTSPMLKEAMAAGFVDRSAHGRLQKIRVVTIRELLEGAKPVPSVIQPRFVEAASKRPRRADPRQGELLLPMPSLKLGKADVVAPGFEQWRGKAS